MRLHCKPSRQHHCRLRSPRRLWPRPRPSVRAIRRSLRRRPLPPQGRRLRRCLRRLPHRGGCRHAGTRLARLKLKALYAANLRRACGVTFTREMARHRLARVTLIAAALGTRLAQAFAPNPHPRAAGWDVGTSRPPPSCRPVSGLRALHA
eukprot:scaffold5311_cov120-Isochrysis_galbana.AAC.12